MLSSLFKVFSRLTDRKNLGRSERLVLSAIAAFFLVFAGCGDSQPRVVEPTGEFSFDDMNAMAAEDAAESEEAER